MLFKVFYQENKNIAPRRENTHSMYVEVETDSVLEGTIKLRELINTKTNYQIEFMDALTAEAEAYERESDNFNLRTL
ncbi:MAG: RNA polymerase epsilon subunit [Lactovum sp.]